MVERELPLFWRRGALWQRVRTVDAQGNTTTFAYDTKGNLLSTEANADAILPMMKEQDWQVHYVFFARAGFSEAARMEAGTVGALLVDLEQMDGDLRSLAPR